MIQLDAGSVIPDPIRDRHDGQKTSGFLNYDTASSPGMTGKIPQPLDYRSTDNLQLISTQPRCYFFNHTAVQSNAMAG
jgi:hypothetical protein